MEQQGQKSFQGQKNKKNMNKKDLLKYERPIFELKRNNEGKVEGIIEKLMQQQKQKPDIGFLPRSHLLHQLDSFLPVLKQSNTKLMATQVTPEQMIDAKMQQIQESSSSSSSSQDEDEMVDEGQKMQKQKAQPTNLQSCDEFQFNIMTYPYLQPQTQSQKETQILTSKFQKVVQLKDPNSQMQQLD